MQKCSAPSDVFGIYKVLDEKMKDPVLKKYGLAIIFTLIGSASFSLMGIWAIAHNKGVVAVSVSWAVAAAFLVCTGVFALGWRLHSYGKECDEKDASDTILHYDYDIPYSA